MKFISRRGDDMIVSLTGEELSILRQALTEVCHGLDVWDFATRMGAERSEVVKLIHGIGTILSRGDASED